MPGHAPVLALVIGLPGAGKTTYATALEQRLQAVRLCADDWLDELAIDLWDEEARDRVEQLQWGLARRFLQLGVSVAIEWGLGPAPSAPGSATREDVSAHAWSCTTSMPRLTCCISVSLSGRKSGPRSPASSS